MDTKLLSTNIEDLNIAAEILLKGGNVIFPTETVYGIGADAMNKEAVSSIFVAKGRPSDNPLIVHISSMDMLTNIVEEVPDSAKKLMEKYWPGPLTVILKKKKNIPDETTAGLDTVAVRMPESLVARKLIELADIPVAAPSANLSGKPSPTKAQHCIDDMMGRVDAIICGDDCEVGVESTVIDMSGDVPMLFRPGGITLEQLTEVLGDVKIATAIKSDEIPKSPGLKYKHYAPNAEVVILSGSYDEACAYIKNEAKTRNVGVLSFDEFPSVSNAKNISLGSINNPQDAARRLFSALRQMDKLSVDVIYAPEISNKGMWDAVRNRLYRSAGEKIINLSLDVRKILFVCTGNTCRSPMAEGIFNDEVKRKQLPYVAMSAGIYTDGSAYSKNSVEVMRELEIDISNGHSKQITAEMVNDAHIILTMTKAHKDTLVSVFGCSDKIKTIAEFAGTSDDIIDPYGGDVALYRICRDKIKVLVSKIIEKLML